MILHFLSLIPWPKRERPAVTGVKEDGRRRHGLAVAQCRLAACHQEGDGVAKDQAEALNWLRKAADQGNADAKDALKRLAPP